MYCLLNAHQQGDAPLRILMLSAIIGTLLIACSLPGTASARTLTAQLRWEPGSSSGWMNSVLVEEGSRLRRANADTGFGFGISINRWILRAGLALERVEITNVYGYDEDTRTITFITPSFSGQYYFQPPTLGAPASFVIGRVGKTLASFGKLFNNTKGYEREEDLFSPWIISMGGGGEYFLRETVSLGMETGVRYASSYSNKGLRFQDEWSSMTLFDFLYGVVTLNFFWS